MLYAVIMRFDSLREIEASMQAEVRKIGHIGLETVPRRSTLLDANAPRDSLRWFVATFTSKTRQLFARTAEEMRQRIG